MRESFGGTMMFWIVLFFMSIFIAFLASVIKYARVYKMKNTLINYIERQEGIVDPGEVANQLLSYGYPYNSYFDICVNSPKEDSAYYTMKLNATFTLPIISYTFNVPIRGETRLIETGVIATSTNFIGQHCWYNCKPSDGNCESQAKSITKH